MKVLVSGSTGLIGSAMVARFQQAGHKITRLVRSSGQFKEDAIIWDPSRGQLDRAALEGYDAVVHLAGENISTHRWSSTVKQRIRDSRVIGTRLLAEALASLDKRPGVFISASATGYYGEHGDRFVTEETPSGRDFLALVCREWEEVCRPAVKAGIRVVHPRTGMVLSAKGGALARMLPVFRFCLGGRLGDGRQYMSWITLDDEVAALAHLLESETISGPVNLAAPGPVTNREFTKTLGRTLGRPAIFAVPAFALRMVFGEMADALLLTSTRVSSEKLRVSGFEFKHDQLETALKSML